MSAYRKLLLINAQINSGCLCPLLLRAIQYTVEEQGREMAVYCDPLYDEIIGKTH